ncbi:carbonic anhydrase family protein [Altererythrobacter halimionae]|uniref:carbonic anhydrase n=2 Tax=Alteriqipengyuania halimionae TaxID=1926630 RepID=A0A6I4TZG1_9SPHN|nr:carbonic anhydrase family protein [Alteriqipengyuania halimionae]
MLLPNLLAPDPGADPDWVYGDGELPEKWSIDNDSYAVCDTGQMQSPIVLSDTNARASIAFAASYGEADGKLKRGRGKVQVDVDSGMGMVSGDTLFSLLQMHFHTPAEHMLHGERYPLVVHLVHGSRDGEFAVLGVMFEEGDANPAIAAILDALESEGKEVMLDIASLVPERPDLYRYMGSLTTPPCTEGVNWHVADEVLEASEEQIAAMARILGASNRSLQPLNNRLIIGPED